MPRPEVTIRVSLHVDRGRRGMTLVELLLVLVLLVIAGSLVAPAFTGSFASVRLRRAGDRVLTCWANARERAVTTGKTHQFAFVPETGQYRWAVWTAADMESAAGAAGSGGPGAISNPVTTSAALGDGKEPRGVFRNLPASITFQSGQLASNDPLSRQRVVHSLGEGGTSWSAPILFFPDGSASEATVVLANDRSQFLRLTLRELTGVGRSSGILSRDELDRGARAR